MNIVKTFLCVTLLCTGVTQAEVGNSQNWLSTTIDNRLNSLIEQIKTTSLPFQRYIWHPICERIPFAQPTADFIAEHKKASLLAGTVLGYAAYKWYDNKMSTWVLHQADGTTVPTCLNENSNGASTSQPRYDARLHIINTITENAQTLSDMLFSLHNKGTTQGMAWPWSKNTHPNTQPSITFKAFSGSTACFEIKTTLNTTNDDNHAITIEILNIMRSSRLTASGPTFAAALQNLAKYIIQDTNSITNDTRDNTENWNAFCGDALTAYKIEANCQTPQSLQFICDTKVRRLTQPANSTIRANTTLGTNLKDVSFFQEKCISCFTQKDEPKQIRQPEASVNQASQAVPTLNQATGIVSETEDSESFYDFRYHVDQFIRSNLQFIENVIKRTESTSVTFRGSINPPAGTQRRPSFDLIISYSTNNEQVCLTLQNNQDQHANVSTEKNNLHAAYADLQTILNDKNLNAWCGDSLHDLKALDEDNFIAQVPTFACTTGYSDEVLSKDLNHLHDSIFTGFNQAN